MFVCFCFFFKKKDVFEYCEIKVTPFKMRLFVSIVCIFLSLIAIIGLKLC